MKKNTGPDSPRPPGGRVMWVLWTITLLVLAMYCHNVWFTALFGVLLGIDVMGAASRWFHRRQGCPFPTTCVYPGSKR